MINYLNLCSLVKIIPEPTREVLKNSWPCGRLTGKDIKSLDPEDYGAS